jgi:hypothetical protein
VWIASTHTSNTKKTQKEKWPNEFLSKLILPVWIFFQGDAISYLGIGDLIESLKKEEKKMQTTNDSQGMRDLTWLVLSSGFFLLSPLGFWEWNNQVNYYIFVKKMS